MARSPFSGQDDVAGSIYAYNANKGMLLFLDFPTANTSFLVRPKWRGLRLLMPIPRTCIPPATPANDCQSSFGGRQEMVLVELTVKIVAKSSGRGDNRRILLRTPKTCPSGGWTFKAHIKYDDGSSVDIPEKSRCSG